MILRLCSYSAILCCLATAVASGVSRAAELTLSGTADVVAYAKPAVVFIRHRTETGEQSTGAGFLVNTAGLVVTCAHLVKPQPKPKSGIADRIWVRTYDGCVYEANRTHCDSETDIALLEIGAREYPYLDMERAVPRLGDEVIVIGYPLGEALGKEPAVTKGIISALRLSNTAYQLDAAVNPGNSGGPVLNVNGDVLGVLSFKVRGAEGLGFAVVASLFPLTDWKSGMEDKPYMKGILDAHRQSLVTHNTRSPLHRAADAGDVEQVRRLIAEGWNVNGPDADMCTPLHYAAMFNWNKRPDGYEAKKLATLRLLLDKGADVNAREETGETALRKALYLGRPEYVKLLVEHGADVNAVDSVSLDTPLHMAARGGGVENVQFLIEHSANINARDREGTTPLGAARRSLSQNATLGDKYQDMKQRLEERLREVVHVLLEHGATE